MTGLSGWESYYVILGSSAAALIGLQFVVITLIAGERHRRTSTALGAFATPTVVHFVSALIISVTMSAPWPSRSDIAIPLTIAGLAGVVYGIAVMRRAKRQTVYQPVTEDWIWHVVLPGLSYAALVVGALLLRSSAVRAPFTIAAAALTLLLIGIHNAWDTVTYLVVNPVQGDAVSSAPQEEYTPPDA